MKNTKILRRSKLWLKELKMGNPRVAILASGEGTTAEAFIKAGAGGKISAQAGLIICSNENAGIFQRVKKLNRQFGLNIECLHISKMNYPAKSNEIVRPGEQTSAEEAAIFEALETGHFDLVALMGYMKKVGPHLVQQFGWKPSYKSPYQAMMVNTHPGLLPATKGLYGINVQEFVIKNRLPEGGQTLHIVAEDYDDGPIIAEHKVPVEQKDTAKRLFERVKEIEKKYLPKDIDKFIKGRQKYLETEAI